MREMMVVCVGQAGIQMSNAVWELFCLEHGISPDGNFSSKVAEEDKENLQGLNSFFFPSIYGNVVPRCTMIDLEPTVIDEIRTGSYRDLFHPEELISSCEDAANVFARGFYSAGKAIQPHCQERMRQMAERSERLRGIIMISSYGGGTGSGLGCLLTEYLNIMHSKIALTHITVYPGGQLSTSTVEPYNAVHALRYSVDYSDMAIMFDNASMYRICSSSLKITRPTYNHLNRITSQVYSGITASLRYKSALDSHIDHHLTNGVPYPRLHFMLSASAPFMRYGCVTKEKLSVIDLTADVFDSANQLMACDLKMGKYMSCMLQYRGDISCKQVYSCLMKMKAGNLGVPSAFVDWCPTGFKVGLTATPSTWVPASNQAAAPRSVTMLSNHTGITIGWQNLAGKFDNLFRKRAFVHWYVGEGMEESEFTEAREEMESIVQDYVSTNPVSNDEPPPNEEKDPVAKSPEATPKLSPDTKPTSERQDGSISAVQANKIEQNPKNSPLNQASPSLSKNVTEENTTRTSEISETTENTSVSKQTFEIKSSPKLTPKSVASPAENTKTQETQSVSQANSDRTTESEDEDDEDSD